MQPRPLYQASDLLDGFDADDPLGFTSTWDFRTYQDFIASGGPAPATLGDGVVGAIHDAEIAESLRRFLRLHKPRLVGFMGGHKLKRSEAAYEAVARLAKRLSESGFMVASGGGPGAMEAAHLGAATAGQDDSTLDQALDGLKEVPEIPPLMGVLNPDGTIKDDRRGDLEKAHRWMAAAIEVRDGLPSIADSLAIPTWLYGQEPTMPFATAYAKYFQNSIREEALVQQSRAGIIYARGGGGTIREIFQDVEENYYAASVEAFTPMIFFDPDGYWQRTGTLESPGIKVDVVLAETFRFAHAKRPPVEPYLQKMLFTTEHGEIIDCLEEHAPLAQEAMMRMIA